MQKESELMSNIFKVDKNFNVNTSIKKEDIPAMAKHAAHEANPLYPVPKLMDAKELEQFYYIVADWS